MSDDGKTTKLSEEQIRAAKRALQDEEQGRLSPRTLGDEVQLRTREDIKRGPEATGMVRSRDGVEYLKFNETLRHRYPKVNGKVSKRARNKARKFHQLAHELTRKEARALASRAGQERADANRD